MGSWDPGRTCTAQTLAPYVFGKIRRVIALLPTDDVVRESAIAISDDLRLKSI